MKQLTFALVAALAVGALAAPAAQAQSMEEVDQLMQEIRDGMQDLEQMLAKASLDPADIDATTELLRRAAESGEVANLPAELQDLLRNNPDVLARLVAGDDATAEEQLAVEQRIRELLGERNGIEQLLEETPDLLERLAEDSDAVADALRRHVEIEDDLESLFDDTKSSMAETEEQLEDLIEMAEAMQ